MTVEQGAVEADVKIRTPRHGWIGSFVSPGFSLAAAGVAVMTGWPWFALCWLAVASTLQWPCRRGLLALI
jgi:hypothetical protein